MKDKFAKVDLAARDPRALRSIAGGSLGGYTCPICCASFEASPELWEHAWHAHPGSPEVTGDSGEREGEGRRRRARHLATENKAVAHRSPSPHNVVSNEKDSAQATIRLNARDYDEPHSTINPDTWLRGGVLPTSPHVNRQMTQSYNRKFRPNNSETEAKPLKVEGQMLASGRPPPDDDDDPEGPETELEILLQLETRPISHEQLVVEVKGIYTGLVMVEDKCIDIDERQFAAAREKEPAKRIQLNDDQWQSLIALHKQLLHEHYDFFKASQQPCASPALSRLAAKYRMPARMWRHGIHTFLEVLQRRLPESREHMLAFIYIAYGMIALLYETVPTFEDTWIECLGDLGRYRRAIAKGRRDKEAWNNAARFWYHKAADKNHTIGRLYHHLAILARPYTPEQLSLYTRALTCLTPFERARGSILTLFNPFLQGKNLASHFDTLFIKAHGILFTSQPLDPLDQFDKIVEELDTGCLYTYYISKTKFRFKETGVHVAVSNIAALFEYGTSKQSSSPSRLRSAYENAHRVKEQLPQPGPQPQADTSMTSESETSPVFIIRASRLASITLGIALTRAKDRNIYPLVHVYLVFIWSLVLVHQAWKKFEDDLVWRIIEKDMPWATICSFLNTLAAEPQVMTAKIWAEDFPKPDKEAGRPLPEDYVMRGLLYSEGYFPHTWFKDAKIDGDERSFELPSMVQPRVERMLWLGLRIASVSLTAMLLNFTNKLYAARWIRYDMGAELFVVADHVNVYLTADAKLQPEATKQDTIMSDIDITQYPPSETSTKFDIEAPCFTPGTTSNGPSEPPDDSPAPSIGGSE